MLRGLPPLRRISVVRFSKTIDLRARRLFGSPKGNSVEVCSKRKWIIHDS